MIIFLLTWRNKCPYSGMTQHAIPIETLLQERAAVATFLESPSEHSFAELFNIYTPQLISFFRARGSERALSEELAQEVMFIAYRKAGQVRDRTLFRAWLFKVARNALCRHYKKQEALTLRFVEGWEYDEIAAEKAIPVGTLRWRVFNAKKKLAPYLKVIWQDPPAPVPGNGTALRRAVGRTKWLPDRAHNSEIRERKVWILRATDPA